MRKKQDTYEKEIFSQYGMHWKVRKTIGYIPIENNVFFGMYKKIRDTYRYLVFLAYVCIKRKGVHTKRAFCNFWYALVEVEAEKIHTKKSPYTYLVCIREKMYIPDNSFFKSLYVQKQKGMPASKAARTE